VDNFHFALDLSTDNYNYEHQDVGLDFDSGATRLCCPDVVFSVSLGAKQF